VGSPSAGRLDEALADALRFVIIGSETPLRRQCLLESRVDPAKIDARAC